MAIIQPAASRLIRDAGQHPVAIDAGAVDCPGRSIPRKQSVNSYQALGLISDNAQTVIGKAVRRANMDRMRTIFKSLD